MKNVVLSLMVWGMALSLGGCGSITLGISLGRRPSSLEAPREPERMMVGREAYSKLPHFSELKVQLSEIGVIHTEESELSSWKWECLNQQALVLHELLGEDRGASRKQLEALHVVGVEFLLADLSEHGASSDRPSVRLLWWEDSDQRGLLVRVVYDPQNPTPELRCRILKSSALERQILQLK